MPLITHTPTSTTTPNSSDYEPGLIGKDLFGDYADYGTAVGELSEGEIDSGGIQITFFKISLICGEAFLKPGVRSSPSCLMNLFRRATSRNVHPFLAKYLFPISHESQK